MEDTHHEKEWLASCQLGVGGAQTPVSYPGCSSKRGKQRNHGAVESWTESVWNREEAEGGGGRGWGGILGWWGVVQEQTDLSRRFSRTGGQSG